MNVFFKPGVLLMNKLKYPKKMALIAAIAILVVIILIYQLISQSMSIMRFSNKELLGIQYINPLVQVMEQIQSYRGTENLLLLGDVSQKSKLDSERDDIEEAILAVDKKEAELGTTLKTKEEWNTIKAKWQAIKNSTSGSPEKSNFDSLSVLVTSIGNLIVTACDTSNLTLDPDIDTYYFMDTYCTKIPRFTEEASLIRDIGTKILMTKTLTKPEENKLVINKTLMDQFNKVGIKTNIDKSIAARPSLGDFFEPLTGLLVTHTNDLTQLVDSTLLANDLTVNPVSFSNQYTTLINSSYKLYAATGDTLYSMIKERVNSILSQLYTNLAIVTISLLLFIYLFIGIYYSIVNSIQSLVRGSETLANGDLTAEVVLETNDELVQVASGFNTMRNTLSKIITELHQVVSGATQGDLTKRIKLEGKNGFSRDLSEAVNLVSDSFQTVISETTRVLDCLSKGDLTQRITHEYKGSFGDLKNYINMTMESLEKLVTNIKISTETINTAAKEIAMGNNDLAKRTEQQAAFLEETAASIDQVTSTVKRNADNAKQANQLAQSASDVAIKGGTVVSEVIDTMTVINDSSRKVADIISVIDDIAFQTNILALNAAVEAARAGEQGRGFAVVATEVRNLAQRTSAAAKEIKMLISTSVENVAGGAKLVDQAGNTMGEIVKAVNKVTEIMGEIASASVEQSNGIEQVNQAIVQMDQVTQQNTALVEEAAAASGSMEAQTNKMDNLVNLFKLRQLPKSKENTSTEKKYDHKNETRNTETIVRKHKDNWDEF